MISRRQFVLASLALGLSGARLATAGHPFGLGVASGYPMPSGVTLWTRVLGVEAPSRVTWEVASDDAMRNVVRSGAAIASPESAHSVHIDVDGLSPDRWYWYRFRTSGAESPIGRTRTAPAAGAPARRLRFAFASCQQYEHGYYGAYRHIVADAPDLVAFLGDYVYEATWGRELVRSHGAPEAFTLDDYRARYALYKSDPDLQAAHAACPWIATWDDHEVVNDYAGDLGTTEFPFGDFLARRGAAYQAYFEHMPLPAALRPRGHRLQLHTALDWGDLVRFHVLDDRQYRSGHACPVPRRRGGASTTLDASQCAELEDPGRTMLGAGQERWLATTLSTSHAAWNVLAQQTRMARWDQKPGPGRAAWTDGWDGYPAARRRLLELLSNRSIRNPVAIGGDVHAFSVAQLKPDFDDHGAPGVASEFVGTSISSYGPSQERLERLLPDNPHVAFVEGRRRGYVRVDVTPRRWTADLRAMETTKVREAGCSTLASFIVEDGRPGPQRVH